MESELLTFKNKAEQLFDIAMKAHKQAIEEDPSQKEHSFRDNLQSLVERLTELRHHIAYSEYKGNGQEAVFGRLGKVADTFTERFIHEAEKPETTR